MMQFKNPEFDSLLPPLALDCWGFLVLAAAAGFTLASGHAIAQTAIATLTDGLVAGPVGISVGNEVLRAYHVQPLGKSRVATVLVISEIFGVHAPIFKTCAGGWQGWAIRP